MEKQGERLEFYASASSGTERAVRDELIELGFRGVRLNTGGIPFLGDWAEGWRACLQSRCAQRILVVLSRFRCSRLEDYDDGVRAVEWERHIGPETSVSVAAHCHSTLLSNPGFAALRAKDAIVDRIRSREGRRPDVNRSDPDARVFVYLADERCTLYLDLAGEPLGQRGYRTESGSAPLRETLAACLLRFSGWDRSAPLIDPMCGAGTLPIEAALWASGTAPGLLRARFGFERWRSFDDSGRDALRALRGAAREAASDTGTRIRGSDNDPAIIEVAQRNARRAGVKVSWDARDIAEWRSDPIRRWMVMNPPYDVRMSADEPLFRQVARAVSGLHGDRVCLIAAHSGYRKAIPCRPVSVFPVKNGDLNAEIIVYDID